MKKEFDCDKCVLTDVCHEKIFVDECISKMETIENNIYNPGIFEYSMKCYHYLHKEDLGY